jgi:hypothetical protein
VTLVSLAPTLTIASAAALLLLYLQVGQKHSGWVGAIQDHMLNALQPIWFNRGESKNRRLVAQKLREHALDASRFPLLVFPEGTCVNNEFVVQFKKGVFELGVPINPVALCYNNFFVDGYWNSRAQSFAGHLFSLMSSWAVVCDVYYMDPMHRFPGESAVDFAKRVQLAIAARAGLTAVDWDGYMKYWKPSRRFMAARQQQVAEDVKEALGFVEEERRDEGHGDDAVGLDLDPSMAPSLLRHASAPASLLSPLLFPPPRHSSAGAETGTGAGIVRSGGGPEVVGLRHRATAAAAAAAAAASAGDGESDSKDPPS